MLVDCQRFPPSVSSYELEFGISHARMAGQPSNALVPESVGRGVYPCFLGIMFDDLLHPPGRELAISTGLKQPAIVGMGGDVRPQGSGKPLSEQDISVLAPLPWLTKILQFSKSISSTSILHSSETRTPV